MQEVKEAMKNLNTEPPKQQTLLTFFQQENGLASEECKFLTDNLPTLNKDQLRVVYKLVKSHATESQKDFEFDLHELPVPLQKQLLKYTQDCTAKKKVKPMIY